MEKKRAISGGAIIAMGQAGTQACGLVRNVIIARFLAPEAFGIATTLALVATFLESISYVAADRLVVQAPDGATPQFLATAHLLQVVRGAILAVVVFACAWPLSAFFHGEEYLWAYAAVALVPLLRGLSHLEINVHQRSLRFGTTVGVEAGAQAVSVIAAIAIVPFVRSPSALAIVLIIQAAASCIGSFLVATTPYRLRWDPACGRRLTSFGWPVLVNGVLFFLAAEGDRFIIGRAFGPEALGWYGAAATLANAPAAALNRIVTSVGLPLLATRQDDADGFARRYAFIAGLGAAVSVALGAVCLVAAPAIIAIVYGRDFAPAAPLLSILALTQALRMLRVPPTLAALARADSINLMLSNVVRVIGFPFAVAAGVLRSPLSVIPGIGAAAEIAAGVVATQLAWRRHALPRVLIVRPAIVACSCLALAAAASLSLRSTPDWIQLACGLAAAGCSVLVVTASVASLRSEALRLVGAIRRRIVGLVG